MLKGLIIVFVMVGGMAFFTISLWHFTSSFPPPVSAPPPTPAATGSTSSGASAGGGATPAAAPGTLTIPAGASTQGNPAYLPDTLTVKKGDVVTVKNTDNVPHTATNGATPDDPQTGKLFDTSLIMPGKTAQIKTASLAPGDYKYHCTVHPYMTGTLTVKG
jgi:plastocyanin